MKLLRNDIQDCEEFLERGTVISLKVGINPKTGKSAFLPQFVCDDNLLKKDGRQADSFRVFIPDREAEYQKGEIWTVEIQSWNISNKITRDNRRHIHIYVRVIRREERIEEEIDWASKKLIARTMSGNRVIRKVGIPLKEEKKWYRENDQALCVIAYLAGVRLVDYWIRETMSRQEYANNMTQILGRKVSPKTLNLVFYKLPPLPTV